MKSTDIIQPAAISAPIAYEGLKNQIPENATGTELASIAEGFPEITMKNPKNGGLPPRGQDCNGMFYLSTDQRVYLQNGGLITFSQSVSDTIGGYPLGAILDYISTGGVYSKVRSLIDDNTYNFVTNPSYIDNIHWQTVSISSDYSSLLANNQVTNCILTSNDPSITSTSHTSVSYVNKDCIISGTTASGFSASNYILLSKTMTTATAFTFEIPFVLTSTTGSQTIAYINNGKNSIGISNGVLTLNYDGYKIQGTTQLTASTAYTVKLTRTSANYTVQVKTSAGEYGDAEITLASSLSYFGGKSIYLGGGDDNYLKGSIDLSGVVITSSGSSYWTNTTTSNFQTVNISGTFQVLMPDGRNNDLTLNNVNQSITLDDIILYSPVNGEKTILVTSDGEVMIRDYYEESYTEPDNVPLNGIWFDKTSNNMKTQLTTYPNLIINGATFTNGVGSNFSQSKYLELPESYNLGTAWSMAINVNIAANSGSDTNVIVGDMTAAAEGAAYPYLPDNIAIVYDGDETVTAYLRREDVYVVNKTEVISTAYEVTKTVSESVITGYVAVEGTADSYVTADTQVYSDTALSIPLETAAADTWMYSGGSTQNTQDITGYVREAGTTLVSSGVTVYSDANLISAQGVASGVDWVYSGATTPSIIAALGASVTTGATTLTLSFNGTAYDFNGTTFSSTDLIKSRFNIYLGAAPSYTNGYFNSTINIGASTFSFWNWNGESSTVQNFVNTVACKIGKTTDNGTNISSRSLDYPLCLAKDYDVVHNTGDETIEGEKTFENPLTVNDTSTFNNNITLDDGKLILNDNGVYQTTTIRVNLNNQTDSTAGAYQTDITAYKSSGVRTSNLRMGYSNNNTGGISELNVCNSSGSITGGIGIYSTASGAVTTKAPTPAANNSSTQIATTAFVKDCFTNSRSNFITFSKSTNGYIKFSNGIIIQWGIYLLKAISGIVTLPTAYKTTFTTQLTDGGSGCYPFGAYRGSSKTQFTVYAERNPSDQYGIWWITIGY